MTSSVLVGCEKAVGPSSRSDVAKQCLLDTVYSRLSVLSSRIYFPDTVLLYQKMTFPNRLALLDFAHIYSAIAKALRVGPEPFFVQRIDDYNEWNNTQNSNSSGWV